MLRRVLTKCSRYFQILLEVHPEVHVSRVESVSPKFLQYKLVRMGINEMVHVKGFEYIQGIGIIKGVVQPSFVKDGKKVSCTDYRVHTDNGHVPTTANDIRLYDVHSVVVVGFIMPQLVPVNECTTMGFRSIFEGEERADTCNSYVVHAGPGSTVFCHVNTIVPGAGYFAHPPITHSPDNFMEHTPGTALITWCVK